MRARLSPASWLILGCLAALPCRADFVGPQTPLDARRLVLLRNTDARHRIGSEDPSAPTP